KGHKQRHRNGDDHDERASHVQQEDEEHQAHHHHFLPYGVLERIDRFLDEARPVIGHLQGDALWKTLLHVLDLLLHTSDHILRVLAVAHDPDAAHFLATPVLVHDAKAQF